MLTEHDLDDLAAGLTPVRPPRPLALTGALSLLVAVEAALFAWAGFARPDLDAAATHPSFWWKVASLTILAAVGGATAIGSLDPTRSPRPGLRRMAGVALLAICAGWIIDASHADDRPLIDRLWIAQGLDCVATMVTLSLPVVLAFGLSLRRGAPTDLRGSATAAGAAGAVAGALVFALHCPGDDPLYVVVWYALGCGAVTFAARAILPRLVRW